MTTDPNHYKILPKGYYLETNSIKWRFCMPLYTSKLGIFLAKNDHFFTRPSINAYNKKEIAIEEAVLHNDRQIRYMQNLVNNRWKIVKP
jgi:hypothetical protein